VAWVGALVAGNVGVLVLISVEVQAEITRKPHNKIMSLYLFFIPFSR